MIKGLAITPPIVGRISIGKVVEKNGKRLPEKDDQFTITSLVQNKDGWLMVAMWMFVLRYWIYILCGLLDCIEMPSAEREAKRENQIHTNRDI